MRIMCQLDLFISRGTVHHLAFIQHNQSLQVVQILTRPPRFAQTEI